MINYRQICPVAFGSGTVKQTGEIVGSLGCTKVLLVSDAVISGTQGYADCKASLEAAGIGVVEFAGCLPEAPAATVAEAAELGQREGVDGIVAIGGGSVMDAAKASNVLLANPGPLSDYYLMAKPIAPGVPVVMVPTTSGTGSENSVFSVVTAKRVAQELRDGYVVNLGIGIPTLVADHLPEGVEVVFQSENGILGSGPAAGPDAGNDITNAGGAPITVRSGASFFDASTSFSIIRGGHVDVTVLGALQVDAHGNLASWMVPGKMVSGMGGAMDLVVGARKVVVAMEHTAKGNPKILDKCVFPLTAAHVVDMIVTEMGVMEVTPSGLVLREIAPGLTPEDVQAVTAAELTIADDLRVMPVEEAVAL